MEILAELQSQRSASDSHLELVTLTLWPQRYERQFSEHNLIAMLMLAHCSYVQLKTLWADNSKIHFNKTG